MFLCLRRGVFIPRICKATIIATEKMRFSAKSILTDASGHIFDAILHLNMLPSPSFLSSSIIVWILSSLRRTWMIGIEGNRVFSSKWLKLYLSF